MKTVIITGATSGIGFAAAREFASQNWLVIGLGHDEERCRSACDDLINQFPDNRICYFSADLMQLSEVRRVSGILINYLEQNCHGRLDALINNAGCVRSWYATTEDGFEQQFALNHLGGYLLTRMLLNYLLRANGRILFTGSRSHRGIDIKWNDIMYKKHYRPLRVYKQSKLCNLLTAYELNKRYSQSNLRAFVIDPGLVRTDIGNKQTGWLVNMIWSLRKQHGKPAMIPARTYTFLCLEGKEPDGLYYRGKNKRSYSRYVNAENAARLYNYSARLCGLSEGD
jgi:NAD(P)-dependent dehydrogenase (short-subunit alcohol dehydrogenase family)